MKRERITERDFFSQEERVDIFNKTGYKCAHCGKPIHVSPGAGELGTVDHFIPLNKGGSNQFVNLIPLCEDCNQEKSDKVVSPDYLKYVKEEPLEAVTSYYNAYIGSFEYLDRRNLFKNDEYIMPVYMGPMNYKSKPRVMDKEFALTRIPYRDFDDAFAFLFDYMKKYDVLKSEEELERNLEFWFKFGAIYCVRDADGIRLLAPIVIRQLEGGQRDLAVYLFSKYSNDAAKRIAFALPVFIAGKLCRENRLSGIAVTAALCWNDSLSRAFTRVFGCTLCENIAYASVDFASNPDGSKEDTEAFYRAFDDVFGKVVDFFDRPGYESARWMGMDMLYGYEDYCIEHYKEVS